MKSLQTTSPPDFFGLILYVPIINFSVMAGQVSLCLTSTKQGYMCLAQEHNAVMRHWKGGGGPSIPYPFNLFEKYFLSLK